MVLTDFGVKRGREVVNPEGGMNVGGGQGKKGAKSNFDVP